MLGVIKRLGVRLKLDSVIETNLLLTEKQEKSKKQMISGITSATVLEEVLKSTLKLLSELMRLLDFVRLICIPLLGLLWNPMENGLVSLVLTK